MNTDEVNLRDVTLFARSEEYQLFRKPRAEAPVFFHEEPNVPGFYVVTRHSDVVCVVRNAANGLIIG